MNELTYTNAAGREVTGTQVGRFLIRMRGDDESCPRGTEALVFIIEHIPEGIPVMRFDSRSVALQFADDISRFAEKDPDSPDVSAVREQLGPNVMGWMVDCHKKGRFVDFRRWLWIRGQRTWPALEPERSVEP